MAERREKGIQMFKKFDWLMRTVLKYNDYVVVLANLEIAFVTYLFAPSTSDNHTPAAPSDTIWALVVVYLNVLAIK